VQTFSIDTTSLVNPIIAWLNHVLPRVPLVVLGLLVGILLVRLLSRLTRRILKFTALQKGLRQIMGSTIETVLWLLLVVLVFQWLGFSNMLVFLSSSTLAIGILLAAGGSTLLSDLIAGIFLARDTDFNVGDEVMIGENQTQGVIESMDVRRVRLRDIDGQLHVLPNSVVERKEWIVINKRPQTTALAKATTAAKRLREVAREKAARRRDSTDQAHS